MWFRKVKLPGRTVWTTGRILHSLVGPYIGIWKYFYTQKNQHRGELGHGTILSWAAQPQSNLLISFCIYWTEFVPETNSKCCWDFQCLEDDSFPFGGENLPISELLLLILGSAQELNFQSLPLWRFRVLPQWGFHKLDTKLLDALTARLGRSSWKPSLQVS